MSIDNILRRANNSSTAVLKVVCTFGKFMKFNASHHFCPAKAFLAQEGAAPGLHKTVIS